MTEKQNRPMKIVAVSVEVIALLPTIQQLRVEELAELKSHLEYLSTVSYEERVKERKLREAKN